MSSLFQNFMNGVSINFLNMFRLFFFHIQLLIRLNSYFSKYKSPNFVFNSIWFFYFMPVCCSCCECLDIQFVSTYFNSGNCICNFLKDESWKLYCVFWRVNCLDREQRLDNPFTRVCVFPRHPSFTRCQPVGYSGIMILIITADRCSVRYYLLHSQL